MRYALRALGRSPMFTAVAILTLGLGIGSSAALFSVADPLLTRPLPVRAPGDLVLFRTLGSPAWSDVEALVPFALYERLAEESTSFSGVFVFDSGIGALRIRTPQGERLGRVVRPMLVSGTFFDILGVRPALGRLFSASDDEPDVEPRAVLSYAFWQEQYGGDADVIGTSLALDPPLMRAEPRIVTIVGVAPRGFYGVELDVVPDMWLTVVPTRLAAIPPALAAFPELRAAQLGGVVHSMGRLRPGVSVQQAQADVDLLATSVFSHLSGQYAGVAAARPRIRVEPASTGYSVIRERLREPAWILMLAVGFVLLMSCANVAALLLARAAARQKEIAVRLSLGSGRLGVVRLVLTESLIVATAGGVLAVLVAWSATRAAPVYLPAGFGLIGEIGVDGRVLTFTAALALLSVLVFGLAPALWIGQLPLEPAMREGPAPAHLSGSAARIHQLIVPVQVAFAIVLLAGAGLFLRTLGELRAIETGFDEERLVHFGLEYEARMPGSGSAGSLYVPPGLLDRLASLPGVESMTFHEGVGPLQREETPAPSSSDVSPGGEHAEVVNLLVGPRFFETMGIPIVAGRTFRREDHPVGGEALAIVSESLATHLFGGAEAAIGQFVSVVARHEVIGVAADVTHHSLRAPRARTIYTPWPPAASPRSTITLRTSGDGARLAPAIRSAVREFDTRFEVRDLRTFGEVREASILRERALAHVSTVFAVMAALLTAIGISGIVAYAIARRRAEIALRMALGARVRQVIREVVRRSMGPVAAGAGLGLLGIAAGTPLLATQLFGVTPHDPLAIGTAVLIVAASAALAAYLPARRAARRIDPIVLLKGE